MRYSTKHKTWGRSQLVQKLRGILDDVDHALAALNANDIDSVRDALRHASLECHDAAVVMDIYKLDRKRIRAALEREQKVLANIINMARGIPITQDEKILAKRKKAEGGLKPAAAPAIVQPTPEVKRKRGGLKQHPVKKKVVHSKKGAKHARAKNTRAKSGHKQSPGHARHGSSMGPAS